MQTRPAAARERSIRPRDLALDIPLDTPRYWLGNDPYATHLMNALSLVFPPGERFFIDAVRHFRNQLRDPELASQVRGFMGQEALHSREHKGFNSWLARFGIDADAIEQRVSQEIERRRAMRKPIDDLAVTCALEHFTAIMAESWLHEAELRESAHTTLARLWTWHALEELDHKSVAFDVYREVGGDEATRRRWMLRISIGFVLGISIMHLQFLAADGQLKRPAYLAKQWWRFWGPRGYFTRLIPAYLRYYRSDFHPWNEDHSQLIAHFERELALAAAAGPVDPAASSAA
jgi:uncharacterized protein